MSVADLIGGSANYKILSLTSTQTVVYSYNYFSQLGAGFTLSS